MRLFAIFAERRLGEPILRGGVYNPGSEAYQVTRAVLEAFAARVEKDGAVPVFLLFPDYGDLVTRKAGGTVAYAPLRADLERGRFPVLDLADGFARHDPAGRLLVHKFAHYRSAGNRIVARTLLDFLAARGLAGRPQAR